MQVRELFEETIPTILRDDPERAKVLAGTVLFVISGEHGGTWFIDPNASPPSVSKHANGVIACTVRARYDDFQTMLDEPKTAVRLFQQGKIQVTGDARVVARFHLLLA